MASRSLILAHLRDSTIKICRYGNHHKKQITEICVFLNLADMAQYWNQICIFGADNQPENGKINLEKPLPMHTYAHKKPENQNQSGDSHLSRDKKNAQAPFPFQDNRPEALAHRKRQEAANHSPVASQLKRLQNLPSEPLQFAGHRPAVDMTINYQGNDWTVFVSAPNNPQISIRRPPNHTQPINWQTANFTINRQNNDQDHDLRRGEAAYDAPGFASKREHQILAQFQRAKAQALAMAKNTARPHVNQTNRQALDDKTLEDFRISQIGLTLIGASSKQPSEWKLTWPEGDRRTWEFTIDVDNPEAESSQEPHVGWEVLARAGTQAAVGRVLGHVWLDYVPTSRGEL